MKRLYALLAASIMAWNASAQAPSLIAEDMPQAGDKYVMSNGNAAGFELADVAATGADYTWSFDLQSASQQIDTMFSMLDVPLLYNVFIGADYADNTAPDIDFPIPGFNFSITDIYNFYNRTGSLVEQLGFGATISGAEVPVFFTGDNDLLFELPLDFGDTYSSSTSFFIPIPGVGTWYQTRNRMNTVDGWGTLQGPLGDQQVLRVRSEVSYMDSVHVSFQGFEFGVPIPRQDVEYKWLAASFGAPLLQINTTTNPLTNDETITLVKFRDVPNGLEQVLAANQPFTLYPQPASNHVTIVNPFANQHNVMLTLCDVTGRMIKDEEVSRNGLVHLDVTDVPGGIYLLTLQSGDEAFTRRVAVTR